MTAVEQGIFLVDRQGLIRHASVVGPIDPVPTAGELSALIDTHCADEARVT